MGGEVRGRSREGRGYGYAVRGGVLFKGFVGGGGGEVDGEMGGDGDLGRWDK